MLKVGFCLRSNLVHALYITVPRILILVCTGNTFFFHQVTQNVMHYDLYTQIIGRAFLVLLNNFNLYEMNVCYLAFMISF